MNSVIAIVFWLSCSSFVHSQLDISPIITVLLQGGLNTDIKKFPAICSLQREGEHYCAANIIHEKYLVTAAHCVHDDAKDVISVICGITEINKEHEVKAMKIARMVAHPNFTKSDLLMHNDIGFIELDDKILFDETKQPIQLADNCLNDDRLPGKIAGWGYLRSDAGKPANHLQELNTEILPIKDCQQHFSSLNDKQICTFTERGQGTCYADSGGPLIVDEKLWGTVSWGIPCAEGNPDIYTRVGCFKDWIEKQKQYSHIDSKL